MARGSYRFQVEVSTAAWQELLERAVRDRRPARAEAGWLLERELLGEPAPKRSPSDALAEVGA